MTFTPTKIPGVTIVDCDVFRDDRGAFARAWMPDEFVAHGLDTRIAQCSLVTNRARGTLRGMHLQRTPHDGSKTVRAIRGAIFDVAIDLRPGSPTYRQWFGVELRADNFRILYVPAGCAHGYQTLTDDTDVLYFVSAPYAPDYQDGVRWDDPAFGVQWPLGAPSRIHDRDRTYPDFVDRRP